ncbi:MAG: hypothetical protein EBY42_06495, partial [Actinobacteria bacterium]|nr:hypothetical protein [Actinomycetota bacterium]
GDGCHLGAGDVVTEDSGGWGGNGHGLLLLTSGWWRRLKPALQRGAQGTVPPGGSVGLSLGESIRSEDAGEGDPRLWEAT